MANLNKIRDLCEKRNLTLKDLAEKVGLTQGGIQNILKENNTRVNTLEKISEILEVPTSIFFDDGTPDDLIKTIADLKDELRRSEYTIKSLNLNLEEERQKTIMYEDLIEIVDEKILGLIPLNKLSEKGADALMEYDRVRGAIYDSFEFDEEDEDTKPYKPFYITYLKSVIEDQNKKLKELQNKKANK